jgi:hypothetical protein
METVYWALGIHDPEFVKRVGEREAVYRVLQAKSAWAVLSFRVVQGDDPGLRSAEQATGTTFDGARRYGFHVYRWGAESPDPSDMHVTLLEVLEQAQAYVSDDTVLIQRENGPWTIDRSMPT